MRQDAFTISRKRCLKNWSERNIQMNSYTCREIINTENLDRIIKAKRLDPGQLTQLQRLRKRLKEHDGYAHKVDFALNPQERRGRLVSQAGRVFRTRAQARRPKGSHARQLHRHRHGQRAPVYPLSALQETQSRVSAPRRIHREPRGTSRECHANHRRHHHGPV